MWSHPGKQLLFMGSEFGQPSEWSEERGLDWWILDQPIHRGLLTLVSQMNRVYRAQPSMWSRDNVPGGFDWIDAGYVETKDVSVLGTHENTHPNAVTTHFISNTGRPDRHAHRLPRR